MSSLKDRLEAERIKNLIMEEGKHLGNLMDWSFHEEIDLEDLANLLKQYSEAILTWAANLIEDQAWPHERPEKENQLIYSLADLIRPKN